MAATFISADVRRARKAAQVSHTIISRGCPIKERQLSDSSPAAPAVKGLRVRSHKRAEERAPLTAVASGQIMQLSGAKKTKENLLGRKTIRDGRLHKIAHTTRHSASKLGTLTYLPHAGSRCSDPSTPSSSNCATIAARDPTPSLANIRLKCVHTVHELMFNTPAITLLGCPFATMRTISCSRGLS